MNKLKVVHLRAEEIRSDAGQASDRIHFAILANEVDSRMLVLNKD